MTEPLWNKVGGQDRFVPVVNLTVELSLIAFSHTLTNTGVLIMQCLHIHWFEALSLWPFLILQAQSLADLIIVSRIRFAFTLARDPESGLIKRCFEACSRDTDVRTAW